MHNQWSEWERANAERLARTARERLGWLPNWQAVRAAAEMPENYISGRGVEHYTRYKEDFALLKQLNMNAFRFSIEWSRLEPEEGEWDEAVIEHYRQYFAELKRLDITPVVTLWHWTLPAWFARKGGFAKRANIKYFERYVTKVMQEYGGLLRYVLPLNETNVYTAFSHVSGEWPPQQSSPLVGLRVYVNLARSHRMAYRAIKAHNLSVQVGVAQHLGDIQAAHPNNSLNRLVVAAQAYGWNWWFLDRVRQQLDFIGVNYYHTDLIDWRGRRHNPAEPANDLGWYMAPSRLGALLEQVWKRYHRPIIITENGLADADDTRRQWWLEQTIGAMRESLKMGVDLRGYLHWSLLDNFEWAYGWWPKFGLVGVDRTTMKRTIRPSARWLAAQIKRYG